MASILDLVKHYQHSIEKYPNDEQKVLKCIDKLYNLGVTVQHLQETGVGRTVNALRKEPGDVGQAARALVYKWKVMVAAEESDQEENIDDDTTNHNGYDNRRDYDSNPSDSRNRNDKQEKYDKKQKTEEKHQTQSNGDHSGNKRKYHSSEEEDHDIKKVKHSSTKDNKYIKTEVRIKEEPSDSDSQNDTSSESDSEGSQSSEEERKPDIKIKVEKVEKIEKGDSSVKHSSRNTNDTHRYESSSESGLERYKNNAPETKYSSEKSSKDKSNSLYSHRSSKEIDKSVVKKEKEYRPEKEKSHSEESSNRHKSNKEPEKHKTSSSSEKHKHSSSSEKHKSSSSSEKHQSSSSSEKHKSSSSSEKHKSSSNSDKHKSSSEKHRSEKSSSSTEKHSSSKSDKDKYKSSSDKEISSDKHKSKETSSSSSSKDKHSSSSKDKSKDKSSSSKEKESTHRSDKKHSSSKDAVEKTSDSKRKSDSNQDDASSKKSKHKSSSSGSSKSSSSKSKDDIPKKKSKTNGEHVNSDDGIDCGSGASFAEALGMISPAKTKKKSFTRDSTQSPNSCNEDLSPASLLAPSAKLAPLPALEISALPEISPHYRPRPPPKFLPHFTDENAMSAAISSKNQRTKVYSGNKVVGKITSLYDMCVHILQEHIDALEYTGGVPYEILKPVVDKATPQQLFMLEHYNPYLMEDTDHLWQKFCERSFRNKKRQEYESWREMYMRCQEEQEIKLKSLTNNIKIAQEAKKAPIKQTKMAYVDSVVKPPRNILKKQAQHGTAFAATASPAARVAALAAAPNVLKGGRAAPAPVLTPSSAALKPKKAPLMQKALQFMRGRKR